MPPFDDRGMLPPTDTGVPYPATLFEVHRRFVAEQENRVWRRELFNGWRRLALQIERHCPGAHWWLWGPFVTAQPRPRFGDREALTCLVVLPHDEIDRIADDELGQLISSLQRAERDLRVDPCWVVDLPADHEDYLKQRFAVEKYRDRAIRSPLDDDERPVGYVEVHP